MRSLYFRFDEKLWQHSLESRAVESKRCQSNSASCCDKFTGYSDCCLCSKCSYCAEYVDSDERVSSLDFNLTVDEGLRHLIKIQEFRRVANLKSKWEKYDLLPVALQYLYLLYSFIPSNLVSTTVLVTVMEESLSAVNSLTYSELFRHLHSLLIEKLQKFMRPLLSKYMSHPRNNGVFNLPVDPLSLELPDYYKKINYNPMDFSTIKNKLSCNGYDSLELFYRDLELVFTNAMLYNKETHVVHMSAKFLLSDSFIEFQQYQSKYVIEVIDVARYTYIYLTLFICIGGKEINSSLYLL